MEQGEDQAMEVDVCNGKRARKQKKIRLGCPLKKINPPLLKQKTHVRP
jgi:hypothetical protein